MLVSKIKEDLTLEVIVRLLFQDLEDTATVDNMSCVNRKHPLANLFTIFENMLILVNRKGIIPCMR